MRQNRLSTDQFHPTNGMACPNKGLHGTDISLQTKIGRCIQKNIPMYEISGIYMAILENCHYYRLPQPVQISSELELFMKEEILKLITEEALDQQLKARNKIRQYGMPDKEFGFELKVKHFLKLMFVHFTSQSYGARIENRLSKEYNLTKVPSSKDEGDATTSNGKSVEIKISFKNSSNDFSFVQIRPHQQCDLYLLQAINPDEDFKQYSFLITSKNIGAVLNKFKASNCHGVSNKKKDTSQEELRFSVKYESDDWKYLVANFLCKNLIKKLSQV